MPISISIYNSASSEYSGRKIIIESTAYFKIKTKNKKEEPDYHNTSNTKSLSDSFFRRGSRFDYHAGIDDDPVFTAENIPDRSVG